MTKWFDTNYHYIVPEFTADTQFNLDCSHLSEQWREALAQGVRAKPVIVGPLTSLWLGKARDDSDKLALLPRLMAAYRALLSHHDLVGDGADANRVIESRMQGTRIDQIRSAELFDTSQPLHDGEVRDLDFRRVEFDIAVNRVS